MTLTAIESFQLLVQKLYESQLNFYMSETPYSAQILIRKKFQKTTISSPSSENEKIRHLETQVVELQEKVRNYSEIIDSLETKVGQAEEKASKVFEEKKTEIAVLKNTLKKSNNEIDEAKKDLVNERKALKEKEKVIGKLVHKCENLERNNKTFKCDLIKVKNENKKLLKNREQASSRTTKTALDNETFKDHKTDSNQTFQSDSSSSLRLCPSSTSRPPPESVFSYTPPPSTQSDARTPSAATQPSSQICTVAGIQPCMQPAGSEFSIEQTKLTPEFASSDNVKPSTESLQDETFSCFVCNKIFSKAEFLIKHTESDHGLELCLYKLTDRGEEDQFIRFLKSVKFDQEYIEQRLKYYPVDWEHVEERIKFRKLAQLKLEITSKQIEKNMENNDISSIRYCGWSYDSNAI